MMKRLKWVLVLLTVGLMACSHDAPIDTMSAAQLMHAGEVDLAAHRFESAGRYFDAIRTRFPFQPIAQQAMINGMYAYVQAHESVPALALAETYIRLYPRGADADYAYYIRGMANFNQNIRWYERYFNVDVSARDLADFKVAFRDFSLLLQRFPRSPYVPAARQRMLFIRNVLANHELEVARFYYNRKAYVAAVNRAQLVVLHYQGAPQVVPALRLLVQSYQALGMKQQQLQSAQLLQRLQDKIKTTT